MKNESKRYRNFGHAVSHRFYSKSQLKRTVEGNTEQKENQEEEIVLGTADTMADVSVGWISKQIQKKRIKRKYAGEKRKEQIGTIVDRVRELFKTLLFGVKDYAVKNPQTLSIILVAAIVLIGVMGVCSSCAAVFQGTTGMVLGTSYTANDEDILGANEDYTAMETQLQHKIQNIEKTHPGYDEYTYELQEINHNPYELISYLTIYHEDFKREEIQEELSGLFSKQYQLECNEKIEIRTREEERTGYKTVVDPKTGLEKTEPYVYTVVVEYEYRILCVKLSNNGLGKVIQDSGMSADQRERYEILMKTKGNRAYLFEDDIYANTGDYLEYDIPGEALTDTEFAKLIREAEKYLGRTYVWGGSNPQTGFDCSGFVCWVFNQTGTNVGRTTANGLLNKCSIIRTSEAKPGDLIFFKGTYDVPGASHVGIYVGNNMMIHCGNPISYASISSAYWQEHFYCFGRL